MSRRFVITPALIVFTLLSSLGESLHALPGLDHHDETAACQVKTDHVEAPAEDHQSDCSLCQLAAPFEAVPPGERSTGSIPVVAGSYTTDFFYQTQNRFETDSARAPPLG